MNKLVVIGLIFLSVGSSVIPISGFNLEQSSISNSSGNTFYVGGSGEGNYTKIQDAIDNASDGDTVFVYNGTYVENLIINKSIDLIGEDRNITIIDGNFNGDVIWVNSDYVTFSGFTVQNTSDEIPYEYSGIHLVSVNYTTIMNNIIFNNYIGIHLDSLCKNNSVIDNIVHSNYRFGIYVGFSNYNTIIKGNNVSNNLDDGIYMYSSSNIIINSNNLSNNEEGIFLGFSDKNTILGNNISNNFHGIRIRYSNNNNIIDNNILNNDKGIYLPWYNENNIIKGNNLINNDCSIVLLAYSSSNYFYHNNFIYNTCISECCNNIWDNGYPSGGNYWYDYNGTDADGDGIGDTPYNISSGANQDRYPLMQPYNYELPSPDTVYVDDDFDSSVFGWEYDYFRNIQDGIDAVNENGTVNVYNGTYVENVNVWKSISLIGEDKNSTIIEGSGIACVVYISEDGVKIIGFTIKNSGHELYDKGLYISSNNNNISGNFFTNNYYGIYVEESHNNIITGNTFISSSCGIYLVYSIDNTIESNTILSTHTAGIFLQNSSRNNISGNTISNHDWYGIALGDSSGNIITDNTISNNRYGIFLYDSSGNNNISSNTISNNWDAGSGIALWHSGGNNNILGNTISNNSNHGISIHNSSGNNIIGNTISNNGNVGKYSSGIILGFSSGNNNISGNTISNNSMHGIFLQYSSGNIITRNNFIYNNKSVYFRDCKNIWKHNYWNRPRILPKLIFGKIDIGFLEIPWIQFDWHPAQEPYDI